MIIFLEIQVRGPKVNIEKTPSLHYIIIPECIFIIINIIRMHLERKIFEKKKKTKYHHIKTQPCDQ